MFPNLSPEIHLDLAHQRAAELRREVAAYRLGRSVSAARHARSGRRSRNANVRAVRAPAVG